MAGLGATSGGGGARIGPRWG